MRVVVALGGNALLRRHQPLTAENQRENVRVACEALVTTCLAFIAGMHSTKTYGDLASIVGQAVAQSLPELLLDHPQVGRLPSEGGAMNPTQGGEEIGMLARRRDYNRYRTQY